LLSQAQVERDSDSRFKVTFSAGGKTMRVIMEAARSAIHSGAAKLAGFFAAHVSALCKRHPQQASMASFPAKVTSLQRRVTQEFPGGLDAWLQQCLNTSREKLQERWLDAYLTSPVWRFALADGVCGSGAYAGVMVPSVDRVGRYFPLTLVAQLNTEDCLLDVASDLGRQWFDSAESLALGALQRHDPRHERCEDHLFLRARRWRPSFIPTATARRPERPSSGPPLGITASNRHHLDALKQHRESGMPTPEHPFLDLARKGRPSFIPKQVS